MSDAPEAEATPDDKAAPEVEDETHRRFREALEAKKRGQHANQGHEDNKGVGPAVNQTVARREFRRKSG